MFGKNKNVKGFIYEYLDVTAKEYIGHWFISQEINSNWNLISKTVQLTDVSIYREATVAYSPVTYSYLCYYVTECFLCRAV